MRALILFVAFLSSSISAQDGEIGRWYDDPGWMAKTMVIKQTSDIPVSYKMLTEYDDGDTTESVLFESNEGGKLVFREAGNDHGEYYWINDDGALEIYDDDGYIRTAKQIK